MSQCPYCGKPAIERGFCTFCNHSSNERSNAQLLYDALIRDLTELSMNPDCRNLWYDRAESLKSLDKRLYHNVLMLAKEYNEEIRERDKKIAYMDNIDRELRRKFGTTALREMSFFEFCKAYDYTEREIAKKVYIVKNNKIL
ncbi:MAG: hypothetical protein H8D26_04695 [Methanomicrobia archaeon]|nr:hypothetical protein [Methanomicrobia archaeon]